MLSRKAGSNEEGQQLKKPAIGLGELATTAESDWFLGAVLGISPSGTIARISLPLPEGKRRWRCKSASVVVLAKDLLAAGSALLGEARWGGKPRASSRSRQTPR